MNNFWGHPGGGAPKLDTQRYGELNDLLHSPRSKTKQVNYPYAQKLNRYTRYQHSYMLNLYMLFQLLSLNFVIKTKLLRPIGILFICKPFIACILTDMYNANSIKIISRIGKKN